MLPSTNFNKLPRVGGDLRTMERPSPRNTQFGSFLANNNISSTIERAGQQLLRVSASFIALMGQVDSQLRCSGLCAERILGDKRPACCPVLDLKRRVYKSPACPSFSQGRKDGLKLRALPPKKSFRGDHMEPADRPAARYSKVGWLALWAKRSGWHGQTMASLLPHPSMK